MRKFLFIAGLLIITGKVCAQKDRVYAGADKKSILIGEQFHLKLDLEVRKGQQSDFFDIDSIPHFEILNKSRIDTFPSEAGIILSQTLLLTSWDSGHWQIPPFAAGKTKTAALVMDVGFAPLAPNQPYHDIKDILSVKPPQESNWYWYLVGLALLVVLYLLFFPKEKPKEKKEETVVEDKDAYTRALRQIDRLKQDQKMAPREYYTALVDIFREYLEKRKHIHSFSKTTEDLARQIRTLSVPEQPFRELVNTLSLSDLVKFARYQPLPEEQQASIEIIKQSIIIIERVK